MKTLIIHNDVVESGLAQLLETDPQKHHITKHQHITDHTYDTINFANMKICGPEDCVWLMRITDGVES